MILTRAPVRISFGGGGTDLAAYYEYHEGFVVSAAISRACMVMAREPGDGAIRIHSADYRTWVLCQRGEIPAVQEPLVLPKAVLEWFADRGLRERGIDLFLAAEVPPGTGLGSSSAMMVALVHTVAAYVGMPLDAAGAASLASSLEIERLGMPIGKQDQYASAFGGLNAISFTPEGVSVAPLPLAATQQAALGQRLLLFATGQQRHSAGILRQQQADTGTNRVVTESLHRLKALAYEMQAALVAGALDDFGRLLHRSWHEKKQLSTNVSNPEIDGWYGAARAAGALGGKIAGAGGGGFLLLYCPPADQPALRATMSRLGLQELPFDLEPEGAQVVQWGAERMPSGIHSGIH